MRIFQKNHYCHSFHLWLLAFFFLGGFPLPWLANFSSRALAKKPPVILPMGNREARLLKALDEKYSKKMAVKMTVKKVFKQNLLGRKTLSSGSMVLSRGKLHLNFTKPDKSKIIVNHPTMWIVNYPPPEFQGATLQVIQANLKSGRARSQGFINIFAQGGLFKYFRAVGFLREKDQGKTFFLQPNKTTKDFTRAQIRVNRAGNKITQLRYWDDLDNETTYEFHKVQFVKKVHPSLFQFTPPPDADITLY